MRLQHGFLVSLLAIVTCSSAFSDQLLLEQRPHFPSGFGAWTSDRPQNPGGWQATENFRLLGGGEVSGLEWQGIYYDYVDANENPALSDTTDWTVTFHEDRNGRPGAELYSQAVASDGVDRTSLGTAIYSGRTVPIYDYALDLDQPFVAQPDQQYWLSVQATSASRFSFNPLWGWTSGDGGDGRFFHDGFGQVAFRDQDLSFSLHGTRTGDLPSTGPVVESLSQFESAVHDVMQRHNIEAAAVGIMRNGEFVFHRGYGWQDPEHNSQLPEDALMRIASITKPITAAAIRRLADENLISLDDRVFDFGQPEGGILQIDAFGGLGDERIKDIRVRDLLRHRGGWDRDLSADYAFWDVEIANQMGIDSPPGPVAKASYVLGTSLDHAPGSTYAYSNIGFMMLGLVIEQVTGQDYIDVVHERVFDPIGVPRSEIELGRTFVEDRNAREPWYEQPDSWQATNAFAPNGPAVRWPDGGWDHEGAESYGGLIASSKALLAFAENYRVAGDGIGRLRAGNEGQSWNWFHSGSLVGTNTILRQRGGWHNVRGALQQEARHGTTVRIRDQRHL